MPGERHSHQEAGKAHGAYGRLALMAVAHFAAMYVLMYAMVDRLAYAVPNLNQAYMAALMTSPMIIIELLLMGGMYPRRGWNAALLSVGAVVLAGSFLMIREQTAIGDVQFLRSMIPHHSGAILMCRRAQLDDPAIRSLCGQIVAGQQREIDWMRAKLDRPGATIPPPSS
jgi:uncharacterized protein (DUF305 family)